MIGKDGNSQDVVSLTDRDRHARRAPLRQVEAYWHALCEDGQVPLRSQVDPRGIEDALEHAFLLERIAPGMAKFRVAGSDVADLMGMQVAGMPLSCLLVPKDRDALRAAITPLFEDALPVRLSLNAETGLGRPALAADMILMPLRSDFGDVSRALGALVTHGRTGRSPRRFTLEQAACAPAPSPDIYSPAATRSDTKDNSKAAKDPATETTRPDTLPDAGPNTGPNTGPNIGFREPAAAFEPATRKTPRLRLVVSND